MTQLWQFFIILLSALFFSDLSKRFHIPWVVALIAAGVAIGPYGLELLPPTTNPVFEFFADIGIVFLLFVAGLEATAFHSRGQRIVKKSIVFSIINAVIPFVTGYIFGYFLDLSALGSFMLGVVFMTTSIEVVIPTLQSTGYMRKNIGQIVVVSAIIQDIAALVLLSIVLQTSTNVANLPIYIFYPLALLVIIALRSIIPWARERLKDEFRASKSGPAESELLGIFAILVGTIIVFDLIGFHPMVAAFFAGVLLSDSITTEEMKGKIKALSYGLFIPIFFVVVGAQIDISSLLDDTSVLLTALIMLALVLISKFFSAYFAVWKLTKDKPEREFVALAMLPKLSTTLAVGFAGLETGLLSSDIFTAIVVVVVVTTFVSPFLLRLESKKLTS